MTSAFLDTIVAPATPPGRSALAIVRIDGPRSSGMLAALTARTDPLPERLVTRCRLTDREGAIDDCVAVRFEAPRSFTGNDLVELTLHGSAYLVERVVRAAVALGARIAEPGEFTERAVLNGKIDLIQAEAIADLIGSRTALQSRLSIANLEGELSRSAIAIREELLFVISRMEAGLDFSEEGYEFVAREEAERRVAAARTQIRILSETYRRGHATVAGLTAVILGQPNAGKSSLLNFLCGSDRAIVTEIPGTTRDLLRETVEIGGLPVTLIDTAGLRESTDAIESIGIHRARDAASQADLVLYLIDAARGETGEDRLELSRLPSPLRIHTKSDVAADAPPGLAISVRTGAGLPELLRRLDEEVRDRFAVPEGTPTVVNERQRAALAECEDALAAAGESLLAGSLDEIVLVDLNRAANALGVLVGAISRDDVYNEIFSKFCIGK